MKSFWAFAVGVCLMATLGAGSAAAIDHTKDPLDKVREAVKKGEALLIDVREDDEWKAGHLEGAKKVPLSMLEKKAADASFAKELAEKLPKDKVVYCHCRAGRRALKAGDILQKMGYDVRPLKAGYEDLLKAGFPQAPPEKENK